MPVKQQVLHHTTPLSQMSFPTTMGVPLFQVNARVGAAPTSGKELISHCDHASI